MAIDSAAKRRNISGLLTGIVSVGPDIGSTSLSWRQSAGWGYLGVELTTSTGAPAPAAEVTLIYEALRFDQRWKTRHREGTSTGTHFI